MRSFGIMQGRLTPSKGRGIQFFPFENWMQEFEIGAEIGINEIEWVFDYDRYMDNPLWSEDGIRTIKRMISRTGVSVNSVCLDYFMRRPFYKTDHPNKMMDENLDFVKRIIEGMVKIGAGILEIPMVDNSSVKTGEERKQVIDFLSTVLSFADEADILIGCETDFPVGVFRTFLDDIAHPRIRANYDSGNSSGMGYNHYDEIHSLSEYIANVHIKDRVFHGTTAALGTGSADFDQVFFSLKEIGYSGSIILQAARSEEFNEADNIDHQLKFVKNYCQKYGLE